MYIFPSPALDPEIVSKTACMLIEQIVVGISNKCHYNRIAYFVMRSSSVYNIMLVTNPLVHNINNIMTRARRINNNKSLRSGVYRRKSGK